MRNMSKTQKAAIVGTALPLGFFAVTFTIYFFNLDMKLTSKIEPFLIKHYDNMERKQYV